MKRFDVRRAVPADAAILCGLHKASVRALCAGSYSTAQIELWLARGCADDYRRAMTVGGEIMFAATHADHVVGFASTRAGKLLALYVDPRSGRGAGGPLLAAVEEHACHAGEKGLCLQATPNAVAFYRQHGYMRGPRAMVRRGGIELAVLEMTKTF